VNFLRTTSTRRLIAGSVLCAALVAGGVAAATAASGGGTPPPAKSLDAAIHDSLAAPKPMGITARVRFTNNLIASGALPTGSPLLTGASGRLWLSGGRVRLELQSDAGDAQITVADGRISVYDASSNTEYRATLPVKQESGKDGADKSQVPGTAEIASALSQLAQQATVSGAEPTTQAGQPEYKVTITPKHDAGLLGQAEIGWDAANGVPLHISIAAAGSSSPVLALDVTDISYGSVDAGALTIAPPATARIVDLGSLGHATGSDTSAKHETQGLSAVSAAVSFKLSAPDTLVGLPRTGVRLIRDGSDPAALVTYGKGLGAIAVLERAVKQSDQSPSPLSSLPAVSIGGATGHELPTAIGTLITAERGGVSYTLLGSLPANAAEAALRAVLA
jgi:hypothetical protein